MVQEYMIGSSSSCWQLLRPRSIVQAGSSLFSEILCKTSPSIVFCRSSTIRQRIRFAQKHNTQDILPFDLYSFSKPRRKSLRSTLLRIFNATLSCLFNTSADMSSGEGRTVEETWSLAIAIIADWLLKVKVRDIA